MVMKNLVLAKMKHLYVDYPFTRDNLTTLQKWMPHLKKLEAILLPGTFPPVCKLWPELTHLSVLFGSVIYNQTIVGIKFEGRERSPNITDLKHLRSFKVEAYCSAGNITCRAAPQTFLRMKQLDSVDICVAHVRRIV